MILVLDSGPGSGLKNLPDWMWIEAAVPGHRTRCGSETNLILVSLIKEKRQKF